MVEQKQIILEAYPRGFHLITREISQALSSMNIRSGIAQVFIQHTSAGLTINENADPTVRLDFESFVNRLVPENQAYFQHDYEGPDDMPAHIKASLFGSSVSFPVANGQPLLGTWQGIYLCEHRNHGGRRKLILTLVGD